MYQNPEFLCSLKPIYINKILFKFYQNDYGSISSRSSSIDEYTLANN